MKLIEVNWNPTTRQLRQFGVLCLLALPLVGWLWGASAYAIGMLATVGFVCAVLGCVFPRVLGPIFVTLSLLTAPIGMVLGEAAMLLIYFGVFVPLGLWFRLIGRDALALRRDPRAATYWQAKQPPRSVAQYYRQS